MQPRHCCPMPPDGICTVWRISCTIDRDIHAEVSNLHFFFKNLLPGVLACCLLLRCSLKDG